MTFSVAVCVCTRPPLVPVIVTWIVDELDLGALIVRPALVLVELDVKVAVKLLGRPETLSATTPVNPFSGLTVIVKVVEPGVNR